MSRVRSILVPALAVVLLGGCDDDPVAPEDPEDPVQALLAEIRSATEGYRQVDAAVAAGYAEASPCVASPDGGMGFHYAMQALIDASVEPTAPELLLYEPVTGGGLRLVGVEYMVMAPEWDPANDAPPELLGHAFEDHRPEEARHGLPFPHYDLHVWAWEPNPGGTFAPFNPNVSCDGAG